MKVDKYVKHIVIGVIAVAILGMCAVLLVYDKYDAGNNYNEVAVVSDNTSGLISSGYINDYNSSEYWRSKYYYALDKYDDLLDICAKYDSLLIDIGTKYNNKLMECKTYSDNLTAEYEKLKLENLQLQAQYAARPTITIEKEVPLELKAWQSLEELQEFLGDNHYLITLQADATGMISIQDYCEDIAMSLCDKARQSGRLIETEILVQSEVLKYYDVVNRPEAPHCICKAVVGNCVYFIDPRDNSLWLAYYLD